MFTRILVLCCALAAPASYAIPVTYQFNGTLAHSSGTTEPPSTAIGYVTFDTDAAIIEGADYIGENPIENGKTSGMRYNVFANPIISAWVGYGDNNFYASGTPSAGSIYNYLMVDGTPNYTEWYFGAETTSVNGEGLSFYYDSRCDIHFCPAASLDALFAYDDLRDVSAMWYTGIFTFNLSNQDGMRAIYNVTSFTKVPEPATALLFGVGILGLALTRRHSARD